MVTMNDIAERAGVSRPTVSVVLNERHADIGIARETRLKVLAIAEELGYRRNELARAVKTGKSHTLGFLAGTVHMEYASRCFSGMLDAAEDRGYSIQRFRINDEPQDKKAIVRCVEHRLAGVVVYDPDLRLPFDVMKHEFEYHEVPTVLLDFKTSHQMSAGVCSDDELGSRQAVQHLAGLGHKRIAFLGGIKNVGTGIPRSKGYEAAMRGCGLGPYIHAEWCDWSYALAEKKIREVMGSPTPPTAMIFGSDPLAIQALRLLREMGLRVPHDISVVGFGDLARTYLTDPALTTVCVPYEEMGQEAVRLLLEPKAPKNPKFGAKQSDGVHYLPTDLTIRNSTAPPR